MVVRKVAKEETPVEEKVVVMEEGMKVEIMVAVVKVVEME